MVLCHLWSVFGRLQVCYSPMRKFTISDIHGCAKTFKALLNRISFSKEDELYLLGDYIDRGPDSRGVIDHIWHLQKTGHTDPAVGNQKEYRGVGRDSCY